MPERDGKGRFVKGNSGGGRKRMPAEFKSAARDMAYTALLRLGEIIGDTNSEARDVIAASRVVIDRAYGKPGADELDEAGAATIAKLDQILAGLDKAADDAAK